MVRRMSRYKFRDIATGRKRWHNCPYCGDSPAVRGRFGRTVCQKCGAELAYKDFEKNTRWPRRDMWKFPESQW
jgi:ribosomal protein L37AE/L43A